MHSVVFAQILGLGKNVSSFGSTLALLLTWVVAIGGLANVLVVYVLAQVKAEHKQNLARTRAYDEAHK